MNELMQLRDSERLTMSSLEIATLTGKRHDHVMRDIRIMLAELYGEGGVPSFGGVYTDAKGEKRPCFNLPKRETLILVSGYNVQMRAKLHGEGGALSSEGSYQDSVKRTIERLSDRGVIGLSPLVEVKNHLGQRYRARIEI